jgi:steroid 5-alpha reductase family enzyme
LLDESLALAAAAWLAGSMLGLWLLSLRLKDSSIVDVFWGWGFVCVAWLGWYFGPGTEDRKLLCAGLVSL